MSPLWLFLPICMVTSLVLAATRDDRPLAVLARGARTFVLLSLVVALGCATFWFLQWAQPSRRAFLLGVGGVVVGFFALHALAQALAETPFGKQAHDALAWLGLAMPREVRDGAGSSGGPGGAGGGGGRS
ncbi:MAG: hypothetical protein HYZ53_01865 [Planctomycetes bacterium]|nr:hypothetical protein [Planctomycetota bacterium]